MLRDGITISNPSSASPNRKQRVFSTHHTSPSFSAQS